MGGFCFVEGEIEELIEEFNDGKVQFAFVKVKDPNSGLPKFVLIAWVISQTPIIVWITSLTSWGKCGEGVP